MLAVLFLNRMSMKRRVARKQRASKLSTIEVTLPKASDTLCCRTCLSTEQLEPIFSSKESAKKRSHELHLATGLKIKMNDCLSQKICSNCVDSLKIAIQFRRASRKAEKMLLDLIATEKPKKKYKLRRKVVKTPKVKTKTEKDTDDKYDVFVDIGYDDYQNEDSFNDDSYQNETFPNDMDDSIVKEEVIEPTVKKKPAAVKRKRTVIPNASSYKCNTCNKEFRMKATYKAHMRFHTNYCVCETCGKRCRNNNQLQEHKRARHGLGRIHKCAYCEYSSATKEALTIHERRHTGERPYVCDHCGATFHRRSNLVQHIAIHLPEKNFQCKICGKREKSKKLLAVHSYKAHRRSRYKYLCPLCRTAFSRPGNARQHLSRTHGVLRTEQGPIERVEITYSAVDTNFATLVLRQADSEHL